MNYDHELDADYGVQGWLDLDYAEVIPPKPIVSATINATSTFGVAVSILKPVAPAQISATSTIKTIFPPHKNTDMGFRLGDAVTLAKGMAFATDFQNGTGKVYKWVDPTEPATFTSASFPSVFGAAQSQIVYDSVNDALYSGLGIGSAKNGYIYKINPNTLAITTLVSNFSMAPSTSFPIGANSAICTDGTNIYVITQATAENSRIYKFTVAGVAVANIQLPNQPGGGDTRNGSTILVSGGFLYIGGTGSSGSWYAKVPTDLSSTTVVALDLSQVDDDTHIVGSYVWAGSENLAENGKLAKIALSNLAITYFYTGTGQGVDGFDDDGTYLWVGHMGDIGATPVTPSQIAKLDPSTGAVVAMYSLYAGEASVNELFRVANGLFITTYENSSHVIFHSLGPTPAIGTVATINATSTVSGSVTKATGVISPATINATSAVSGRVTALRRITTATINALSAVSGAVRALRRIAPAQISATSAVSGSVVVRRAILPATINALSAVSGSIRALRRIAPATISATSTVSGIVSKTGLAVIVPANINATSTVSGSVRVLRRVAGQVNATSVVSGSVTAKKFVSPGQINATSTVSGSVRVLRAVVPGQISAFSTISGSVTARRAIAPAQINATSAVSVVLTKLGTKPIIGAVINATASVSASVVYKRAIRGGIISATSAVSATPTVARAIRSGIITATSTLSGSIRMRRGILPATILATSTVAGQVRMRRGILPATITASSTISATLTARRRIGAGNIFATSTVSASVFLLPRGVVWPVKKTGRVHDTLAGGIVHGSTGKIQSRRVGSVS